MNISNFKSGYNVQNYDIIIEINLSASWHRGTTMDENNNIENTIEEEEYCTAGWDAITAAFEKLYPNQTEPMHLGTLISWRLGGNDPLDGISIYDGGDFYHFVTYGLSELYDKESHDLEYSGYGFELTVKLKKEGLKDSDAEIRCMAGILESIARSTFNNYEIYQPNEYIYTGQTGGMDAEGKSKITGFITKLDEVGEIQTPNGKVQFVELIGMQDDELRLLIDKKIKVEDILNKYENLLTDYTRDSIAAELAI